MREKRMRRVLVWFLLLSLIMGQGNMAFAAKPVKPTPEPTSSLDITTGDLTLTVQEDQVINFTVNASTKEEYAIIWETTTSDYGLLNLTETTPPVAKPGKKVTAYLQEATFLFKPSDVDSDQTAVFTITAVKPDDPTNKDQITVTITVIPVETQVPFVYVALGDSIPAGYSAEKSLPKIIESYTDKIFYTLLNKYENVEYYDTSVSGLNIYDVYNQVKNYTDVRGYIVSADLITLCIGANDIMDAAPESTFGRDFYNIDWKVADSGLDNIYEYWDDIIKEIYILNSDVELVVMNMYNPYTISDSKVNATVHEVYSREKMHFLVDKYFYSVEDLNPSKNDGVDYGLNYIIENPDLVYENFTRRYKIVNVYDYFEVNDPTKSELIAFYNNYWLFIQIKDPHPTQQGQTKLYDLHAATMDW